MTTQQLLYSVRLPIGVPLALLALTLIVGIVLNRKDGVRIDRRIDRLEDALEKRFDKIDGRFDKIDATLTKINDRLGGIELLVNRHDVDIAALKRKTG